MKIEKIIALTIASLAFVLTSCSSTSAPVVASSVPEPRLRTDKQLTDAEKKALEEADLWVPSAKK